MSSEAATSADSAEQDQLPPGVHRVEAAPFVGEDVAAFLKGEPPEVVLNRFQEKYSTYKELELRLVQRKASLKKKIPEIKSTLGMVQFLQEKKECPDDIITNFEVSDNLHAKAVIKNPSHVCLFLGASTMVEYTLDEALELLQKNMSNAEGSLKQINLDLRFLKEQITTSEVNIARVYNYDVKRKRSARPLEVATK